MPGPVGRYGFMTQAQQTLGSAAGRTYALGNGLNPEGSNLIAVHVALVTTATAGNRLMKLRVLDPNLNVLFEYIDPANATASNSWGLNWAAGVAQQSSGLTHCMPLPVGFAIPPGAQINIFDSASVDVNDQIQANAVYQF